MHPKSATSVVFDETRFLCSLFRGRGLYGIINSFLALSLRLPGIHHHVGS